MSDSTKPDTMAETLYQRLMAINRDAFDGQQFHVAYHVLAAALHAARAEENTAHLLEVALRAQEQLADIDCHHPTYEHSTRSAERQGHISVFAQLAHQAQTSEQIIDHDQMQVWHASSLYRTAIRPRTS